MSRLLKVFPFLLTLVLIGCSYLKTDTGPTTPDVETFKKGVVRINNGAGFIIGSKDGVFFIVTAAHVIKNTLQIQFYDNRGLSPISVSVADATVINKPEHDLTILRVKSNVKNYHIFTFSSSPPKLLEDVIVIGFPSSGDGWELFPQKVSSVDSVEMQISKGGNDASGFAGGPVIKDGKVVGMIKAQTSTQLQVLPATIISSIMDAEKAIWSMSPIGIPISSRPMIPTSPRPLPAQVSHQETDSGPTTDVETLKKGVVKINNGAGFIISSKENLLFIVSAKHVVIGRNNELKKLEITFYATRYKRNVFPIDGTIVQQENEVTLLQVEVGKDVWDDFYAFPVLEDSIVQSTGEKVTVIGFPSGSEPWTSIPQNVTNANRLRMEVSKSGGDASGFSGGPVIKDGQVVGMVTDDSPTVLKAVTAIVIRNLAEKNGVLSYKR